MRRRGARPAGPALAVVPAVVPAVLLASALGACGKKEAAPGEPADADVPWDVAAPEPPPRPGMAWVPPGVLIAGTPPDRVPRVADEEMAGEQVVLGGFYIDVFPHPNEVGAIPTTNVTRGEAEALCAEQGKRLCSELEWERACKGPENWTYEYGDVYRQEACQTGTSRALVPNGLNTACVSGFGVQDMHGGVSVWTSSAWRRGDAKPGLFTVRGGNGKEGELVGRCASGRPLPESARRPDVGVRCCAGEPNAFEVVLEVERGDPLRYRPKDPRAGRLAALAPEELRALEARHGPSARFSVDRVWVWHPLGNEELLLAGGCADPPGKARCGVVVARQRLEAWTSLGFVPTGHSTPVLRETEAAREVFVYGGDPRGAFRKRLRYDWGKVSVGAAERKKKRKGRKEPSFD